MTLDAWRRFTTYRAESRDAERMLLHSSNPEVIFSLPDLYIAALRADDESIERYTWEIATKLTQAGAARHQFVEAGHEIQQRYVAKDRLEPGDVIISTNWDTIAERTLMEDLRWTPTDGYGFPVRLEPAWGLPSRRPKNLPTWIPRRSEIRVLKLHGSFGWRTQDDFGPMTGASTQRVWYEAHRTLMKARRVDILGAGLPASDVVIRVLLNPFRFRLKQKQVQIAIHDPSPKSRVRWKEFLGDSVIEYARSASDRLLT